MIRDLIEHNGAFIATKDLTTEEFKNINDFKVVFCFKDLGNRGNFRLISKNSKFKDIEFKNGKRV